MRTRARARANEEARAPAMPGLGQPINSVREGETTLGRTRATMEMGERHIGGRSPERQPSAERTGAQVLTERDQTPPSSNTTVMLDNGSAFTNMASPMGTMVRTQHHGKQKRKRVFLDPWPSPREVKQWWQTEPQAKEGWGH